MQNESSPPPPPAAGGWWSHPLRGFQVGLRMYLRGRMQGFLVGSRRSVYSSVIWFVLEKHQFQGCITCSQRNLWAGPILCDQEQWMPSRSVRTNCNHLKMIKIEGQNLKWMHSQFQLPSSTQTIYELRITSISTANSLTSVLHRNPQSHGEWGLGEDPTVQIRILKDCDSNNDEKANAARSLENLAASPEKRLVVEGAGGVPPLVKLRTTMVMILPRGRLLRFCVGKGQGAGRQNHCGLRRPGGPRGFGWGPQRRWDGEVGEWFGSKSSEAVAWRD